jgi:hypothetical protein
MKRFALGTVSLFVLVVLHPAATGGAEAAKISFDRFHAPAEVVALLKAMAGGNPERASYISLGKSSGGAEIGALRIAAKAPSGPDPDERPAILVSANIEGVHHAGTEAALFLADKLLSSQAKDKSVAELLERRTIYIAPLLNPDAASAYFAAPRFERRTNARPLDDDLDVLADEDGPDDLNGDGLITQMRVKDPEGKWIADPAEPRLMRQADPKKGERGVYALYTEGLDNDGDGEINEDPPGGVEPNRNFPHDFEHHARTAGLHPVSEAETLALVRFLVAHPRIALILNCSTENTILNMTQTGQARAGADKVKVPRQFASFLGLEPDQEYTLKEVVEAANAAGLGGGMEITEDMVASFLGVGAAVALDREDVPVLEAVQKEYKDALKEAKLDYPEARARGAGKGSFAAYAYFQYGAPIFSADLWAVPEPKKEPPRDALTAEKLKAMSPEEFLALGEEKVDAFLKEQGAPPNFKAAMVMNMVKSGQVTPARMAEMMEKMPRRPQASGDEHPDAYVLKWADEAWKGKGFAPWAPFKHPTLGEVEVGGFAPFVRVNPPPSEIEKTAVFHADFFIKLMKKLPALAIKEVKAEALGTDVFRVTAFLANTGWFPTSTAQGRRALAAWPIRVKLKLGAGQSLFSGRSVESIPFLEGSGDTKKVEWTVRAGKGSRLRIEAGSPKLGDASAEIVLK